MLNFVRPCAAVCPWGSGAAVTGVPAPLPCRFVAVLPRNAVFPGGRQAGRLAAVVPASGRSASGSHGSQGGLETGGETTAGPHAPRDKKTKKRGRRQ